MIFYIISRRDKQYITINADAVRILTVNWYIQHYCMIVLIE